MSLGDWVEGRAKSESTKEAQGIRVSQMLIRAFNSCVRALNGHVRAIKALSLILLTLHFRNIFDPCLGLCKQVGKGLGLV